LSNIYRLSITNIEIEIVSDTDNIPERILWGNNTGIEVEEAKAISIAVWDAKGRGSMVMELWNKEMQTLELKGFYLEILKKISETIRTATDDHAISNVIDNACFQISSLIEDEIRR
jgi:gliding motility-associated protein GldC